VKPVFAKIKPFPFFEVYNGDAAQAPARNSDNPDSIIHDPAAPQHPDARRNSDCAAFG
jgi:hypothetical protein